MSEKLQVVHDAGYEFLAVLEGQGSEATPDLFMDLSGTRCHAQKQIIGELITEKVRSYKSAIDNALQILLISIDQLEITEEKIFFATGDGHRYLEQIVQV